MAVLSLFEGSGRDESNIARGRRRISDIGRLTRERRLAFYLGACHALGFDPELQSLRFVRCDDGRLRLFDPSRTSNPLRRVEAVNTVPARLERELDSAAVAVSTGGGIAYDIDLNTGDLRVREMVPASRSSVPPPAPLTPTRYGTHHRMASARSAVR